MSSTISNTRTTKTLVPFCFSSNREALTAELAVNKNFDFGGSSAYATERVLYVPEHKSLSFRLLVEKFVKDLGGRRHTD